LRRFATGKFYMEAAMDGDQIMSLIGCSAEVKMVEMNHLQITTTKSIMYLEIGKEVEWISELDNSDIPTIAELLEDYILYMESVHEGFITTRDPEVELTSPEQYLVEYEECSGKLPEPLKQYFIQLHEQFGIKKEEK